MTLYDRYDLVQTLLYAKLDEKTDSVSIFAHLSKYNLLTFLVKKYFI